MKAGVTCTDDAMETQPSDVFRRELTIKGCLGGNVLAAQDRHRPLTGRPKGANMTTRRRRLHRAIRTRLPSSTEPSAHAFVCSHREGLEP